MKTFVGLLAAFGLVLVLSVAIVRQAVPRELSPVESAQQYAKAEAIYLAAESEAFWHPVRSAALNVGLLAVGALGILYLASLARLHLVQAAAYARPDSQGLLPVERYDQRTAQAALAAFHGAQLAAAQRTNGPTHYAPHINYAINGAMGQGHAELIPANVPPARVPSFGELAAVGRLGPGNSMLLGFDGTGAAVEGSWLDLYSCGVGGLAGSGKSNTAAFLIAQAALFGTKIVILDPHAENEQSLSSKLSGLEGHYLCTPADNARDQLAAVAMVQAELVRRATGGTGEPWLFVADEYTALQRGALAKPLSELVEGLAQEGRKLGLYGLCAGQAWTASRSGGSEVRDSLASAYVHRCRPAQARYLTGLTAADLPHDLLDLPPGSCYLLSTSGDLQRVTIPVVREGDIAAAVTSPRRPIGFVREAAQEAAQEATATSPLPTHCNAPQLSAEEAAIVEGFKSGKSASELASELAGGARGGRAYTAAAERVAAALRRALG
jgi:hypothetical protein